MVRHLPKGSLYTQPGKGGLCQQELLDTLPNTVIPSEPETVVHKVYDSGDPLGGNFCPVASATPSHVRPFTLICWIQESSQR